MNGNLHEEIIHTVGRALTASQDCDIERHSKLGTFKCHIETQKDLTIVRRQFAVADAPVEIPFSNSRPGIQMIFSLDAPTYFRNRNNPLWMAPQSHSLNFLSQYECRNLLTANTRQNDMVLRLDKDFYSDLMLRLIATQEDRLPVMIFQHQEFNTINQHLQADAGISGLLKNIMECPFTGTMRHTFVREHIKALLMLQLFHFSHVVTGEAISLPTKISQADREVLNEVKLYIDQRFLEPTSLHELTVHFGINEFKLKHGFKVLFDTSPIRYLQQKRLQYSRVLLNDTHLTLQQIADSIGYQHTANFTTAFKKMFGQSPSAYRKSIDHSINELVSIG